MEESDLERSSRVLDERDKEVERLRAELDEAEERRQAAFHAWDREMERLVARANKR